MKIIEIHNQYFIDLCGNKCFFRGVNLSGSCKIPTVPNGASHLKEGFYNHLNLSFVGRPFPIQEADEHFRRLKKCGFNLIRLLTTWEAIEHCGPGVYDEMYLDYFEEVVKKAGEYGFTVFIDPHQDVWSRFTGGDGAPGWTLELAGFEIKNLHASGAAIVHNIHGDPYPKMIWPTNNQKLASATMFTLFFAGKDFAPNFEVAGVHIQDYLQDHYIDSIRQVARRLEKYDHVIGYDSLNEPSRGWIGLADLRKNHDRLKLGEMPTPWQSIMLGDGNPQEVEYWKIWKFGLKKDGYRKVNSKGLRAWQPGVECLWKQQGVWSVDDRGKMVLINPYYFAEVDGRPVNFEKDYLLPFIQRFQDAIREEDPKAVIFIEGVPDTVIPLWENSDLDRIVNAIHWYDNTTLITKNFNLTYTMDTDRTKIVFGKKNIKKTFYRQLAERKNIGSKGSVAIPTVLGEFGVPYDLNRKKSFKTGDFSVQTIALDMYYQVIEELFLDSTIWNYTAENCNEHGDLWNNEDLSIFSRDQQLDPKNIYSGGRGLKAIIRPYLRKLSGNPIKQAFDLKRREYILIFEDEEDGVLTIFLPEYHYPRGCNVVFNNGEWSINEEKQELTLNYKGSAQNQLMRILPR